MLEKPVFNTNAEEIAHKQRENALNEALISYQQKKLENTQNTSEREKLQKQKVLLQQTQTVRKEAQSNNKVDELLSRLETEEGRKEKDLLDKRIANKNADKKSGLVVKEHFTSTLAKKRHYENETKGRRR